MTGDGSHFAFSTASTQIIFDSGTSILYVPKSLGTSIQAALLKGIPYVAFRGTFHFLCSSYDKLPSLFIMIQGYWVEVTPSTYVYGVGSSYCQILIGNLGSEMWLVGDVFLRNYYTIWDDANAELTLAPILGGDVTTINSATAPAKTFSNINKPVYKILLWTSVGLIAVGGIAVGVLLYLGVLLKMKYSAKKLNQAKDVEDDSNSDLSNDEFVSQILENGKKQKKSKK